MEKRAIPMTTMRRVVGQRMMESLNSTAQFTLTSEMDVDALMGYMAEKKAAGTPVKFMPALVKIVAMLLGEHEKLNGSIKDGEIIYHDGVNMGVAVALAEGLLVPVIPDADRKTVAEITETYDALVPKARIGRLRATEMSGGTFTISNLGMAGIDAFTPVVNYPESAILGVGRTRETLYLDNGEVKAKKTIVFSLSMDHCLVDGYVGAQFLQALAAVLNDGDKIRALLDA